MATRVFTILAAVLFSTRAPSAEPSPGASRRWPFYVPAESVPPPVKAKERVRGAIDSFVLARLEKEGLSLAPEASRRTLIRRLSHDLVGLPPTPAEVEAFVADGDPRAYEKLVDRLLDDKRYGERWARLWLDLARYADTAGYEGDPDLPHAWRYRDYVIDAFNNDKPYDLFIKEQLAGDELAEIMGAGDLPGVKPEHVVALTFLRLAPFTEPRGDRTRHEFLSEITGTVGSVFLGLTVGCAQCHDHKYDEIPTKDFYRMKAFFSTVSMARPEPGDIYQIGGPLSAGFYRPGEKDWANRTRSRFEREIGESKVELEELRKRLEKRLGVPTSGIGIQSSGGVLANNYLFDKRGVNDGELHVGLISSTGGAWQLYTDGEGPGSTGSLAGGNPGHWYGDLPQARHVALGAYTNGTGELLADGRGAHHGHFAEILIYDHPLDGSERDDLASYVAAKYDGDGAEHPPQAGLRFWLDASDLDANPGTPNPAVGSAVSGWTDRVVGLTLSQEDAARRPKLDALGKAKAPALLFDDDLLVGKVLAAGFLGDQRGSLVTVFSATHGHEGYGFEVGGGGVFVSSVIHPSAGKRRSIDSLIDDPDSGVSKQERRRYRYLQRAEPFIKQRLRRLRPVAMSLRHSYGPPFEPGVPATYVMIRGEYDNLGERVEAGFPSCVTGHGKPARIRLDPFKRWPTRSRRMALARWIASGDNPLTARVMVNRLWYWHFGRGIVPTPSDFGLLSGGPSHRELLDWLARRFVKDRWSIKKMHRLIVTSSVYRQSSFHDDARFSRKDPGNVLLWRFRGRRLEAEAVRDAILSVSGRLNPEQFGLPIFPPLPGDLAEMVKYSSSKWDTQYGPPGRKRSIYIYQQRTLSMPLMQVFDAVVCDASRPRRRASVTPLQALALYNGELVNGELPFFAERVARAAGADLDARVRHAFLLAFSRPPTEDEAERMRALLEGAKTPEDGLAGLCRVLYNANEFVYVD